MSTPDQDLLAALPAQPKTRLVTGVAGLIGPNLLETLLGLDQTVVGLDRRPRQPPGRDLGNPAAVNQVYTVAVGERTTLKALFEAIRETRAPRYPHLREVQKKHLSSTALVGGFSDVRKINLSRFLPTLPDALLSIANAQPL